MRHSYHVFLKSHWFQWDLIKITVFWTVFLQCIDNFTIIYVLIFEVSKGTGFIPEANMGIEIGAKLPLVACLGIIDVYDLSLSRWWGGPALLFVFLKNSEESRNISINISSPNTASMVVEIAPAECCPVCLRVRNEVSPLGMWLCSENRSNSSLWNGSWKLIHYTNMMKNISKFGGKKPKACEQI